MNLSETSSSKSFGRDLHLLSIEGRGICGFTALVTLKEVLRQYQYLRKLPEVPRPCDVFDLAGGTGTGGIIVIMLFRLRMTVDEAIVAFTNLSQDIFSKKSVLQSPQKRKASLLEGAMTTVIHSSLNVDESGAEEIPLLDNEGPKCFVTTSTAKNLSFATLFRTYSAPRHAGSNCTIVEAIRATTAEAPYFPSIDIGDVGTKETFIHAGLRLHNPVNSLLGEAMSIFPGQSISCVLSIGSGVQGITGFKTASSTALVDILKKMMNDSDCISDEVAKELSDKKVFYCRLSVDQGLENIGFEDWERLGEVKTHTRKYLEKYDVSQKVSQTVQVLNQREVMVSTIEESLRALSEVLDDFNLFPGERWSTVISEFIQIVKPSNVATQTLDMQIALLRDTLESCMEGRGFMALPDELMLNIQQLLERVKKMFQDSAGQEDPMTHVHTNIQKLLQHFWLQNHIAGNIAVHDILKYIQKDDSVKKTFIRLEQHAINQNLGNLNVSPFAAYDSFEFSEKVACFKGTRTRLLNEIASWIASDDPGLAPIYVLDGVAGIGKSTIAKTVAENAAGINTLGASFFFSRNDDKRKTAKTFFPTIAYQLAHYDKDFADAIHEALLRTPHVVTQMPVKQYSTLIMEPLTEAFTVAGHPILIVIDALDECEHDADTLLKIFADSIKNMPRLKLFITTRPEYHIRNVLDRYHHLKRFHLQDIEKSVVQSDIRLYLDFHLSEKYVRDKFPGFHIIWKPTEKDMTLLIESCGILFIVASTAVKFILDSKRSDPGKQLSRLLKGVSRQDLSSPKYTTVMDSFYMQILLSAVPDDDDSDNEDNYWFGHYRTVVGTVVALQYPLPCSALSAIIDLAPDDVKRALCHLYSLVAPTGQDLTFRVHHKSFPDFVTSASRCTRTFLVDLPTRHRELGKRCLQLLHCHLKPNIYDLGSSDLFKDNKDIYLTHDRLSQEVVYASTHWATHLCSASELDGEAEQLLEHFAREHLLNWLEVLSFIGRVDTAYPSLNGIGKLLDESKTTAEFTREIFNDGCRFIALNIELLKVAANHLRSAFAFVPQDTRLFQTYRGLAGDNLEVVSGYEKKWNPTISVMRKTDTNFIFVTFSGDGTRLASAGAGGPVWLWDGQTGAEIATLLGHSESTYSVAFSPDGKKLASASYDSTLRLWDVQTSTEIALLLGHEEHVYSVVFSPDGSKLASASYDTTVRLWDVQTGAEIAILPGHSESVMSATFSPDGTRLASASHDTTVRLWDVQSGAQITILQGHSKSVNSAVFSPDGMRLVSASADETVRLWDVQTGAEIAVLRGHSESVCSVVFSLDGKRLASASDDTTVRLWDGQTGTEAAVLQHPARVYSVAFSPDGTRLASACNDGTVRLWDNQTILTSAQISVPPGHSESVSSVVFSPNGTRLASASCDGTVRLWDGQTGAEIAALQGQLKSVNPVVFSSDGTKFTFATNDGTVRLCDGHTGAEIAVLPGHSELVVSGTFSPDGRKLATAWVDGTVLLWDGQTGAEIAILQGHSKSVNSTVFSPDGRKLASASADETVRLWDVQTGAEIAVFRGHSESVNSVVFSPDGGRLATVSADGTVGLWNSETYAEIAVLPGHWKLVDSVVFSPDGTRLTSESDDGTVWMWDAQTGFEIAGVRGSLFSNFSVDGTKFLSINAQGVWYIDCITGVEVDVYLSFGTFIDLHLVVHSPGLDSWVVCANRRQPSLLGLSVVKIDFYGNLSFTSLCWFPPNLPVTHIAVSSLSRVALGCHDGRVLLLDTDFSSLL